ncbi:hypothetical protein Poli38472_008230 [Pythium oligandrum]|uniref:Cytochrome P450 n=1 Tax=Pythium oligandrum TaxID=41045 RepID=A0A8K1CNN3_PYTOL|nr:hypothetical protein Poli38472_008230 [Pythium oligandrum]|eukprot:TMW65588.1 hypothetical protein Poli38472_008230 [Pythium oligandrum]
MLVLKPFLENDSLKTNAAVLGGALAVLLLVSLVSKKQKVIKDKDGNPVKPHQCNEFNNEPWLMKIPGQPDLLCISSPDLIEELTTTQFDNFPKGEYLIDLVKDLLGNGLISSDGERWYHQRKTAVKFFSAKSLRAFMMQSMKKNMQQM